MVKHTVHSYDHDLDLLVNAMNEMMNHVHEELVIAGNNWQTPTVEAVTEAREIDKTVNKLDTQIEQRATNLLALRQPMGIDLRFIVSALKLIITIERMGDLAKNTAKRACNYARQIDADLLNDFENLMKKIISMHESISQNLNLKKENVPYNQICEFDDEVDMITRLIIQKIEDKMVACTDKSSIEIYMNFIFTIKNIERVGDCITKIARICHYIKTGERLGKHQYRVRVEEH
ncbi:MAG: phosphate signaling complex protein PhoU [Sphingobacteriia bacterium]|nr:phosphate signaling complex protein PhoU [Sphingobacteriia bacterium]